MRLNPAFWKHRRVLLTGHTGFKGSWMALLLQELGAHVTGVGLPPETEPNLFSLFTFGGEQPFFFADIRDRAALARIVHEADPEIAIHMAAQPLVRNSYIYPHETFETNAMGTVHLLESLRNAANLLAALIVTTDKVYLNQNGPKAFIESDPLGGADPYSASKAAAEMAVSSYARSFFRPLGIPVSTARAGNIIGGGDWAKDRLVPDLWRARRAKRAVVLRFPHAIRPWQHVLDPLYGYLLYLERMASAPESLNFGPAPDQLWTVLDLAQNVEKHFASKPLFVFEKNSDAHFPEIQTLSIDASLAYRTLGWRCLLDIEKAVEWTCSWYKAFDEGRDVRSLSLTQIQHYFELAESPSKLQDLTC